MWFHCRQDGGRLSISDSAEDRIDAFYCDDDKRKYGRGSEGVAGLDMKKKTRTGMQEGNVDRDGLEEKVVSA